MKKKTTRAKKVRTNIEIGKSSRRKGAHGEIEVAKMCKAWWDQVEFSIFKRTPKSGGWGDSFTRGEFRASGDVCTTSKTWPFTVEVKRREGWVFGVFANGKSSVAWKWWRQAIDAAAEENRIPMLWMRKNRMDWVVLLPEISLIPILARRGIQPDVVFRRLSVGVDDGGLRPVCVTAAKLLAISPHDFLPSKRKRTAVHISDRPSL
jgi:hypothetical protein